MKVRDGLIAGLACLAMLVTAVRAEQLDRMDGKIARKVAKRLCREARAIKNPQIRVSPDLSKTEGVHRSKEVVLVLVPQQDLKEGQEQGMAATKSATGAPLGYLFAYQLVPVIGDKAVETKRLRQLKLTTDDGDQIDVSCLLLAVRQLSSDDWRLYGYGADKQPVVDVRFTEQAGPGRRPVAMECKHVEGTKGDVVITVFDRYQASFKVRYQAE